MGFYGNITNNAKTQFQFDKVFANRKQMDNSAKSDDIYIGRYVLVNYDNTNSSYNKDDFLRIWIDNQGRGYSDMQKKVPLTSGTCKVGDMFLVLANESLTEYDIRTDLHYIYKVTETTSEYTKLEKVTSSDDAYYVKNYNIDIATYGGGRGYDSTVWQKIYVDNTEQYAMIAELNSVVPTFDVVPDAPTLAPLAPHFDAASTDVYYKLHWQPTWGLRVAQAFGVPSDESVIHSSINKDTFEESKTEVAGQIYYNKAGFNPDIRSYNSVVENAVKVTPTGYSGEKYYNHKTGLMTVQNDIQEISINLPAIGNAVSDFWDVMYGKTRNKDIDWDSYKGLRLVGNNQSGGFSYNTENVATVAGAINSIHDLMGMIVEAGNLENSASEDFINITNASIDKIYFNDANSRYYRKSIDYDYTPAEVDYVKVDVSNETYAPGLYYKNIDSSYEPILEKDFDANQVYYEKHLKNNEGIFVKIPALVDYSPATYYAFENSDYILSNEDKFELGRNYYDVSLVDKRDVVEYKQYQYYRKDYSGKWISDESYIDTEEYYTISSELNNDNILYAYYPNAWLYLTEGNIPAIDKNVTATEGREYYHWEFSYNEETGQNEFKVLGTPVRVVNYNEDIHFIYDSETKVYNPLEELDNNNCKSIQFTQIEVKKVEQEFYTKNKYYYRDEENNILLDTSDKFTLTRIYYNPTVDQVYFYREAYYYYIEDISQEYTLDTGNKVTANREYYEKNPYYIIKDTSNTFAVGAPWNANIKRVPCAIDLGIRTVDYKWKELEGFARDINTIHGLLLKINQIVEWNNSEIRDLKTVQGCINTINDLVDKINDLVPGQFVITNAYGQLSPASWTTDNWLQVKVNEETDNIDFQHIGPVGASESFAKSNTSFFIDDEKDSFDLQINFQTMSYDDRGHIYKQTAENIDISTDQWVEISGSSENNSHVLDIQHTGPAGAAEGFDASQTQFSIENDIGTTDTLITMQALSYDARGHIYEQIDENILISTDEWLKVDGSTTIDKDTEERIYGLDISHTGPIATTPISPESDDLNFGESFKIPLLSWDDKGHIYSASNSDRTITLPKPSLNDFAADGHSVLTGISMTSETGAIAQTNAEVGSLKLNSYTQATKDTITQDDSIYTAFYKLSDRAQILEGRVKDHEDKLDNLIGGTLKETFDTLVEMSEWLDSNDTELIESINKEVQNRETADKKHTEDIASNLAAIEALQLNKYDANTQFDWGYIKLQTEEQEVSRVDNGDGTTTVVYESTISYEPKTISLQEILNEIREALGLNQKGNDEGVVTREETIPTES